MKPALLLVRVAVACLAACAAPPASPQFVRWHAAWASERDVPAGCDVIDTATQWRAASAGWPAAAIPRGDDACRFAIERTVACTWPGPWAPPITFTLQDEEDVDVLTVTPSLDPSGRSRGIGCVLVVPAGARPLAIVARAPADASPAEATLGVFAPR